MTEPACLAHEIVNVCAPVVFLWPAFQSRGAVRLYCVLLCVAAALQQLPLRWITQHLVDGFTGLCAALAGLVVWHVAKEAKAPSSLLVFYRQVGLYAVYATLLTYQLAKTQSSWMYIVAYFVVPAAAARDVLSVAFLGVIALHLNRADALLLGADRYNCSFVHVAYVVVAAILLSVIVCRCENPRRLYSIWLTPYDSVSHISPYTLLHIGSGLAIGFTSRAVSADNSLSVAVVFTLLVGWEVVEYSLAPAFGYWSVRNAANSAFDVTAGLWTYMVSHQIVLGSP